ncbi:MAG: amidohydrolase family protein, partial [Trueperaceae bacterium]
MASGREQATLLLAGGRLVNVFTNEVHAADVLVAGRLIAGIFDPDDGAAAERRRNAVEVVDLHGAFVVPGLIDGHVHIESSLVSAAEYARGVLGRGVTGAVCDPHEIANVAGENGVRWLLEATDTLPFDVWVTVPSCVPSSPFETVGADFGLPAMERLLEHPRVVGVAELMSYPDVVAGDPATLAKARLGEERSLPVEGHAPGLSGAALQAYLASGVGSDHESTVLEEGMNKLRSGAFLMVREGSVTRDLNALMPLVHERHGDRIGFVTDDRLPHDLLTEGALELMVRRAVAAGVNPAYAVR